MKNGISDLFRQKHLFVAFGSLWGHSVPSISSLNCERIHHAKLAFHYKNRLGSLLKTSSTHFQF